IIACCSVFTSVYPYASRIFLYKLLTYLGIFLFIINTRRRFSEINRLSWMLVIIAFFCAVVGLTMKVGSLLDLVELPHGFISPFFANHNHYAVFLLMVFQLGIGLAMSNRGISRSVLFSMAIIIAAPIYFSLSRGGIISLMAGLFFYSTVFAYITKRKKSLRSLVLVGLLVLTLLFWLDLETIVERMMTLHDPMLAAKHRIRIWEGTLDMISQRPLFGWGIGTYVYAFPQFKPSSLIRWSVSHAEIDFLDLTAETGIIGFVAVLVFLSVLFVSTLKKLAGTSRQYCQPVGVGALAGCFALLIHSLTESDFRNPSIALLFTVLVAIALLAATKAEGKAQDSLWFDIELTGIKRKSSMVSVCLLAFLSCAAVLSPWIGSLYSEKAEEYTKNGEHDKAVAAMQKAIMLDPGNAELMKRMGDVFRVKKVSGGWLKRVENLKHALGWYELALKACPVRGEYYGDKALMLELLNKPSEAEQAYKLALRYSPTNRLFHQSLAELYLLTDRQDKGLKQYRKFLQLAGKRYPHEILDAIWWGTGQKYSVIKRAIPETAEFRQDFSVFLFAKGKTDAAMQELEFAFTLEPTPKNAIIHLRGICRNRDFFDALAKTEEYLDRFPGNIGLQNQKAKILESLGRRKEAISIYQDLAAKAGAKGDTAPYLQTARLYTKERQVEKAVAVLEQGIEKNPDNAQLHYQLGIYLRSLKKYEQALNALKNAVYLDRQNFRYRYQLGVEYQRNESSQKAIEQWRDCLEIRPDSKRCKAAISGAAR
ncbi:MAG: hypothetical protein D3918_12600, partial [Candidatus Electrothrix sp. AX2]|nr:hypothetical protein [Candidatus Electrothrix gigas]